MIVFLLLSGEVERVESGHALLALFEAQVRERLTRVPHATHPFGVRAVGFLTSPPSEPLWPAATSRTCSPPPDLRHPSRSSSGTLWPAATRHPPCCFSILFLVCEVGTEVEKNATGEELS